MKAHIIQGKQTSEEIETLLCAWLAWTSLKKHAINKQTLAPLWEKTTNQSFYFHAFIELSESFALAIIKVATWQLTPYILCWKGFNFQVYITQMWHWRQTKRTFFFSSLLPHDLHIVAHITSGIRQEKKFLTTWWYGDTLPLLENRKLVVLDTSEKCISNYIDMYAIHCYCIDSVFEYF